MAYEQEINTELIQLLLALARNHRQTAIDSSSRLAKLLRDISIPCCVEIDSIRKYPDAFHAPPNGPHTPGRIDNYQFLVGLFTPDSEPDFELDDSSLREIVRQKTPPKEEPDASPESSSE